MHALYHRSLFLLTAALLSAALSACVPYHFVDAPAVTGQVVSRATNGPVVGANVSIGDGHHQAQARTDQDGRFSLPVVQHYGFYPIFSEGPSPYPGILHVEAAGYRPFTVEAIGWDRSSFPWRRAGPRPDTEYIRYEHQGDLFYQVRVPLAPGA